MIIEFRSYSIECIIIDSGGLGETTTVLITTSGTGLGIGSGGDPAQLNNINIVKRIFYAAHYIYNEGDIAKIKKISVKENLKIITTEKDYCRLNKSMREDINYIKIELSLQNEKEFIDFLKNKI